MKFNEYFDKVAYGSAVSTFIIYILASSLVLNLLLGIKVAFTTERVRQTIVPTTINKTFWIDDQEVSKEYLDMMGLYFTEKMFNSTPATIDTQHTELLKYVTPELYTALDKELRVTSYNMHQTNVATWFVPSFVGSDEKNKTTTIDGEFIVAQNNKIIQRSQKNLEIVFVYSGGKVTVKGFKDKSKTNPNESAVLNVQSSEEDKKPAPANGSTGSTPPKTNVPTN